jgi:hypothetical protein
VGFGVGLGGFGSVVRGVMQMAVRDVGMVRGSMVIASFVVPGGFPMMTCGVLVVLSGFVVMVVCCHLECSFGR